MYFFTIISCLYVLMSFIKNDVRAGFDERIIFFPREMIKDNITRAQIMKIQEKREMLDYLESNETTIGDKLYELGGRSAPDVFSILKGGLLSDWNFEFDIELDEKEFK